MIVSTLLLCLASHREHCPGHSHSQERTSVFSLVAFLSLTLPFLNRKEIPVLMEAASFQLESGTGVRVFLLKRVRTDIFWSFVVFKLFPLVFLIILCSDELLPRSHGTFFSEGKRQRRKVAVQSPTLDSFPTQPSSRILKLSSLKTLFKELVW